MDRTYLVAAGLCLLGLAVRTGYELLKQAGRVRAGNRLAFAVVFAGMCLLLGSWPAMCPLDPWRLPVPDPIRWLGLSAVVAAAALSVGGLAQLRGLEDVDRLVTTGLYSRLRHPMYAGFVLWIAGWVVVNGAVASAGLALVATGCILFWRRLEELALEARWGEAYRAYRRATRLRYSPR